MRRVREKFRWVREDPPLSLAEIAWLASAEGRAVCAEMAASQDWATPAGIARWRARLEPARVAAAARQVHLRAAARAKFSRADAMLFDRVGLEQASDEVIAGWKARRFAPFEQVADFCCGIGGDAIALAGVTRVLAVDWSETKLALARHNVSVYGREARTLAADVSVSRPEAHAIHIDPDRRALGPRRHDPQAGSPGLDDLHRLVGHYLHAGIKLSPGVNFEQLGLDAEIELISHAGECRQAVAWTGGLRSTRRRASALPSGETIEASAETPLDWPQAAVPQAGALLLEPDPAVIRADLVGVLARRHGLAPIDPQVAWLIGGHAPASALLRAYRLLDVADWSLSRARSWLAGHAVGSLEIKTRGFAGRPEEIQRRLRLRGTRHCVLFLTRLGQTATALLAERLRSDDSVRTA